MARNEVYRAAERLIHYMGLPCSNLSMRQFVLGLELLHYDTEQIHSVTKTLYPKIAERYPNANRRSVERNLRSARDAILERSLPERREEVLGYRQIYSYTVAELMDELHFYMDLNGLWPDE